MSFKRAAVVLCCVTWLLAPQAFSRPTSRPNPNLNNDRPNAKKSVPAHVEHGQSDLLKPIQEEQFALVVSPIVLPLFGSMIVDLQSLLEVKLTGSHFFLFGANFSYMSCRDCRYPGYSRSFGFSGYYRQYFLFDFLSSLVFGQAGFEMLNAHAEDRDGSQAAEAYSFEPQILVGMRKYYPSSLFLEAGLGAFYRSREFKSGSYIGYADGLRPRVYFALGLAL